MVKKLSIVTIKVLLGLALLDKSVLALTLNGHEVNFKKENIDTLTIKTRALENRHKAIIVKFNRPLDTKTKEKFFSEGVSSIIYAGELSYYFYAKESVFSKLDFKNSGFLEKTNMRSEYRVKDGGLATFDSSVYQNFNVLFLVELSKSEIESYLLANSIDAAVLKSLPSLRKARLKVATKDIEKLKQLAIIQYMDKSLSLVTVNGKKETRNKTTAKNLNLTALWLDSYNLNGENMDIGVVDGGSILASHQEFNEDGIRRVINKSNSDINSHATHVAGTIAADGDNSKARGMANKSVLYSYGFGEVAFAESILKLYREDGVLLSNHSYGYSDKIRLGEYDSDAASQDTTVSNNPFLNVFQAAGNDGDVGGYADYGIIKGPGNSKNIFTIGALNINSSGVASLSSAGPVNDGRIKPDLCVRGENIDSTSSNSDDSYSTMSGTSMATPAATGAAALIMQQYKRTTGRYDIRHDLLKSIMINTAVDKENVGPDYKAGFGMIDAKAAVDVVKGIKNRDSLVIIDTLSHSTKKSYSFRITQNTPFKTTISWVDKAANPANSVTLVNDIDMLLVNIDNDKIYHPYTLDKNNPNKDASTNKPNRIDNIEQIEISNLPIGNYQLQIYGNVIIDSSQDFAISSNIEIFQNSNIGMLRASKLRNFAKVIDRGIL